MGKTNLNLNSFALDAEPVLSRKYKNYVGVPQGKERSLPKGECFGRPNHRSRGQLRFLIRKVK